MLISNIFSPFLDISGLIPSFSGASYITYPLSGSVSQQTTISLLMRPSSGNGLIVILLDESGQGGDFLALVIIEGVVQLRFDLGKFCCHDVQKQQLNFFQLSCNNSKDIVS